jgi:hypothetical protein
MLPRDLHQADQIEKHFPDYSFYSFHYHAFSNKPYYKYIQFGNDNEKSRAFLKMLICYLICGCGIVFHKRIPKLRNFTTKKARLLFGLLFVGTASVFASVTSSALVLNLKREYRLNVKLFKKLM